MLIIEQLFELLPVLIRSHKGRHLSVHSISYYYLHKCPAFTHKDVLMQQKRIALLIDCDNVSHNAIEGVLEELAKYGMVNVRHAH